MEVIDAILKRTSTRKFTDRPVTDAELKELLEAARWAPSWVNFQIWDFIIVRDQDLKEKIANTYSEKNPARKCTINASALIVCCAKLNVSGCYDGKPTTRFNEWFMFDMGLAIQNICLRAHDLGLGTVIVGSLDHARLNALLSVPEGHEAIVVLPVGEPLNKDKKGPKRKELSEMTYKDTFGNILHI